MTKTFKECCEEIAHLVQLAGEAHGHSSKAIIALASVSAMLHDPQVSMDDKIEFFSHLQKEMQDWKDGFFADWIKANK